jgi:hypothetical protein
MITNTNNLGSVPTPANAALRPSTPRTELPQAAAAAAGDSLSTDHASRLRAALAQTPALRPEVIERASALAKDPGYPSVAIMGKIGRLLAQSKDLSLQEN